MTKIKTARTPEGDKFYYLGHTQAVVDDNGNNIEDLLAEQEEKIELLNDNTGVSEYPEFSTSKTYKTGTIVRHEGALFKFTSNHEPGIWDLGEVKSWSINAETQEKLSELGSEVSETNQSIFNYDKADVLSLKKDIIVVPNESKTIIDYLGDTDCEFTFDGIPNNGTLIGVNTANGNKMSLINISKGDVFPKTIANPRSDLILGEILFYCSSTASVAPMSITIKKNNGVKRTINELSEDIKNIDGKIISSTYKEKALYSINANRIGYSPLVKFYGYDEGGRWIKVENELYKHKMFVVAEGDEIILESGISGSHYAFITDLTEPKELSTINYVDGTERVVVPKNTTKEIVSPANCYLYVLLMYNGNEGYTPQSLKVNGIEQLSIIDSLPNGVLKNDVANKRLTFYGRRKGTCQFFSFRIQHSESESNYQNLWHLTKGHLCNYVNGEFEEVCEIIDDAECEFAMKFEGKADFTGGYHGDERIDIEPSSFVAFFADGRMIASEELQADFVMACESFTYIQHSTLHNTANSGESTNEDHSVIGYHIKKSKFINGKFVVENSVKMASEQTVVTAFAGLFCTSKEIATNMILPFAQKIKLQGDGTQYRCDNKSDAVVEFWDVPKGVKCCMEGHILQGYDDISDVNYYLIWDRTTDSKYYRGNSLSKKFAEGELFRNKFEAIFT